MMPAHKPPKTLYYDELVSSFGDQVGKVIAVTGCTSGMGLVLAKTAARKGARVIMLNRPSERANSALAEARRVGTVEFVPCDLASFASVRAAGAHLRELQKDTGLDVLVNNAGVMGMPDKATEDGFDLQMQANHLSHFLLTQEVWPLLDQAAKLRGDARVVNHSSGARNRPDAELRQPYLEANGGNLGGDSWPGFQKWRRYQQSKLANLLFTYVLQDQANKRSDNRVKALCAHPGPADSGLQAKTTRAGGNTILDRYIINSTLKIAQSQEDGTCGLARAAFDPSAKGGDFFGPEAEKRTGPARLLPPERDPDGEKMLWETSLRSCGIKLFFPLDA